MAKMVEDEAIHPKRVHKNSTENGYLYSRHSGDHAIYVKDGRHISIPQKLECVIARRLIRETILKLTLRKRYESYDSQWA